MQLMHPHDAALALIGLFQEGGADPSAVANELEFLDLGNNYVHDMSKNVAGRNTDVANGIAVAANRIAVAADGDTLLPIQNLGNQFVVLEHLFDDFEGNINWEDDNEDNVNGTVMQSDSFHDQSSYGHSWENGEEAYRRQWLLQMDQSNLIVKGGGCVCLCVLLCQV